MFNKYPPLKRAHLHCPALPGTVGQDRCAPRTSVRQVQVSIAKHSVRNILFVLIFALVLSAHTPELTSALQMDVPLDQALVLEGGESTNPRSSDPATTISGGDKRVFSGLVSFDPNLNLTPDLAERWVISPDGTVYTFYLR